MTKYFLIYSGMEKEVSLEEFCQAEREAGFVPVVPHGQNRRTTLATGGFSFGNLKGVIRDEE